MSWTKKQIIDYAFNELALSSYTYDLMPDQFDIALSKLDAMIASWNGLGLNFGYNLSDIKSSDINQDSGMPDFMNEAVYLHLAIKLAPSFGKVVSIDTKVSANKAYQACLNQLVKYDLKNRNAFTVAGAGNKYRGNTLFLRQSSNDNVNLSNETELEF